MADRGRPDIEQTREAMREHDERTEQPPEVAHPAEEDDEGAAEEDDE